MSFNCYKLIKKFIIIFEARVEQEVAALNEGVSEIVRMKNGMLGALTTHQGYDQNTT